MPVSIADRVLDRFTGRQAADDHVLRQIRSYAGDIASDLEGLIHNPKDFHPDDVRQIESVVAKARKIRELAK